MAHIKEVREIPLSDLEIGKGQVRLRDVGKEIDELADSIRKVGLLEPIVVCEGGMPGKRLIPLSQVHQHIGVAGEI
jgi:ParB-like chromosome segregation protein Spo0J